MNSWNNKERCTVSVPIQPKLIDGLFSGKTEDAPNLKSSDDYLVRTPPERRS